MSSSPTACAPAVAACRRTAPTRTPRAAAMPTSPSRGSARSTTADFHPPASARSCPSPSSTGSAPATAPPTTPAPTMPLKPIAVPPSSPLVAAPATTATTPSLRMLPPTVPRACPRIRPRACPRIRLSYRYPPLSPRQAARRRSARRPRVRRRRVGGVTICSPKNGERERGQRNELDGPPPLCEVVSCVCGSKCTNERCMLCIIFRGFICEMLDFASPWEQCLFVICLSVMSAMRGDSYCEVLK